MRPWSPLPRLLRSYPCKKFQEKASFQPISWQKGNHKSAVISFKKCHCINIIKWVWREINLNQAYKSPSLLILQFICLQDSKNKCERRFSVKLGEFGDCTCALRIRACALRIGRALRVRAVSAVQKLVGCYALGARYALEPARYALGFHLQKFACEPQILLPPQFLQVGLKSLKFLLCKDNMSVKMCQMPSSWNGKFICIMF